MEYLVKMLITNVAHVYVNAPSVEVARNIAENSFGVVMGEVSCSVGEETIIDWNLPHHPNKKIESITVNKK